MASSIRHDELLAPHTTFQIGGVAETFVAVGTESELLEVVQEPGRMHAPWFVLGGGSNILIDDLGFTGLVIHNQILGKEVVQEDSSSVTITVGAGEVFDDVVQWSVDCGYWGLENLSHIPGSVGATPIQNVGAYGIEIGELIDSVHAVDTTECKSIVLTREECQFAYRSSMFKSAVGKRYIVTSVTYRLSKLPQRRLEYRDLAEYFSKQSEPSLATIRSAVIAIRSAKFPDYTKVGTAGSFFKNPIIDREHYQMLLKKYPELPGYSTDEGYIKVPLGWILDHVIGARGLRKGNVGTYEGQALVVINYGDATAEEVTNFVDTLAQQVKQKTGIVIEWEVTKI